MSAAAPRHLDALTGIRGIAAWAVVFYHIRGSLTALMPQWMIGWMSRGYLAVDLFFVLSGFVIWYNYAERIATGGQRAVRLFLWRRFARVWPLHGAVLGAFVALALMLAATGRDTAAYPWAELPLHVLLIQNWGLTDDLAWNHPAWSISTELAAYLVFPVLVVLIPWRRLGEAALLVLVGGLCAALYALFTLRGHTSIGQEITHLGLWRCLAEFPMGMILCQLWQRWRHRPRARLDALVAMTAIAGLALLADLPETAFVPALFFASLLALALDTGPTSRLLGGKVLTYLGEISYSTYLAHFLLFVVFKMIFVDASLQLGWAGLVGYLAMVAAASVALYHGLEKPAQRWLNARPPRWAKGEGAPVSG